MSYGYSETTNAFYDLSREAAFINAGTWPGDVIEVSDDVAAEFTQSPPPGKHRIAGSDSLPRWEDIPPPTDEDVSSTNRMNKNILLERASREINLLTDATDQEVMGDDIDPADVALLKAWKAYRVKVSKLTDMLKPVWPDVPV